MCKQILGISKAQLIIKVLVELGRFQLFVNIQTQKFKFFKWSSFIDNKRYLYEALQEENLQLDG